MLHVVHETIIGSRTGRVISLLRRATWSAALVGTVLLSIDLAASQPETPEAEIVALRRLTSDQYRQSIADIFGADIKVAGRFEPELRREGLLAVGTSAVTVTPSGFEQYDQIARGVASQVVSEKHRTELIGCAPTRADAPDDRCAGTFLSKVGELLFRRPLTTKEALGQVAIARATAEKTGSFYRGIEASLTSMLVAPSFIFRVETGKYGAGATDEAVLDNYSRATRLSFLLWNTTPDRQLLDAAASGELATEAGLARQVARLTASPRFEAGARAFFGDMLGLDAFETLSKDPQIYPKFNPRVAADMREQTLRVMVDYLVRRNTDYREIFTGRKTFLTRNLGTIYELPVASPVGWEAHEFAVGDPRAGLASNLSFLVLHSHPGRSSPTLRGKAIRELLLCQEVPAPPANVDFAVVQDTTNPLFKTARLRLEAHQSSPACVGCHKLTDPLGLALEPFDASGAFRATENGALIDASGKHGGMAFNDAGGLGAALAQDGQTTSCLVGRARAYALGRGAEDSEQAKVEALRTGFVKSGYRFRALIQAIATSPEFYRAPARAAATKAAAGASLPKRG